MSELSYQQMGVMQRAEHQRDSIHEFNSALRKRAGLVCVASTTIVGIVTGAKFLPESATVGGVESFLLGVVVALSVLIYAIASRAMLPSEVATAGTWDTDVLFDLYLCKDVQDAYNSFLIDICEVIRIAHEQNVETRKVLRRCILAFEFQIGVLALAIGWGGLTGLLDLLPVNI